MTQKNQKVILTGIKPSGMPHLGNYCGAIKPMIDFVENKKDNETIYMFIPDIHVVNTGLEPAKIRGFSYGMLASYLACGLDPEKAIVFRQSAIRQHAELATYLNNFTPKGMMNRAHSYKAAVDKNIKELNGNIENHFGLNILKEQLEQLEQKVQETKGRKEASRYLNGYNYVRSLIANNNSMDAGINMGLYNYPILMAADILMYQTNTVPVGKDQIQHIEMARDIANSFNNRYSPTFTLPDYESKEDAPEITGLDGRKMSKSYGNHIPLFCTENELKSLIKKIITDSAKPEEKKPDARNSTIVQLYALFASEEQTAEFTSRLEKGGFGYGDAKQELFELMNAELSPRRKRYNELMADRQKLDAIFEKHEEQARRVAEKTMRKVRKKMGLVDKI